MFRQSEFTMGYSLANNDLHGHPAVPRLQPPLRKLWRTRRRARTNGPACSSVTPKTHTRVSRLQGRGHRFYSPSLGRFVSSDPISDFASPAAQWVVARDRHKVVVQSRRDSDGRLHDSFRSKKSNEIWKDQLGANSYTLVLNQTLALIDPLGADWVAPNPNLPPVSGPYPGAPLPGIPNPNLPPVTGPFPGRSPIDLGAAVRNLGRATFILRLCVCSSCFVDTAAIELACAIYAGSDYNNCVCSSVRSNTQWQRTCNACAFPVSMVLEIDRVFGCSAP